MHATANRPSGATLRALVQPKSITPTAPSMCHLGLRWSAHPNPTWHIWMPSSGSCAASEPAIHEVAPSGAPASPATCACRTRPRHSATARSNDTNLYNAPTATGRVASHPHTTVWPPAPPLSPHRRPGTARAAVVSPDPTETEWRPQRTFWGWCQPGPNSIPVQRLGVGTRVALVLQRPFGKPST